MCVCVCVCVFERVGEGKQNRFEKGPNISASKKYLHQHKNCRNTYLTAVVYD